MKNEANNNLQDSKEHIDHNALTPLINNNNQIQIIIPLSNKICWGLYIVYVAIFVLTALESGFIPAGKTEIAKSLQANDTEFGFLGSSDYLGRITGSVIFSVIINKANRKYLLAFTLVLKAISFLVGFLQTNLIVHFIMRGISGFCQVYFTIYLPIWCDQYGQRKKRTMMISLLHVGFPIGVISGYAIFIVTKSWKMSFLIEAIVVFALGIIVLFFPMTYFSNTLILSENEDEGYTINDSPSPIIDNNEEGKPTSSSELASATNSPLSSLYSNFKIIICEMVFLFTGLSNSVVIFVMGIIQFWGPNYLETLFEKETTETERFIAFGIICITAPIFGLIFGGVMGTVLGGYVNKKAILICIGLSIASSVFGIFIGYMSTLLTLAIIVWFFFFFASGLIPLESGIIIASLPNELRGDGFSIMNFIINLAGSVPPSWIFGKLKTELGDARKAMKIIMYYNLFGLLCVLIGTIFRLRKKDDKTDVSNQDNHTNNANE